MTKINNNVCAHALSLFHFSHGKHALRIYGLEDFAKYSKGTQNKKVGQTGEYT
jgi:hypothetical protein